MHVVTHKDAKSLKHRSRNWLLGDEKLNNGIIGSLDLMAEHSAVFAPPYWHATIEEDGEILGVAMHSKPDGLVTTELPEECLDDVFSEVDRAIGPPHRIYAPVNIAASLAAGWAKSRGMRQELQMTWNVYTISSPATHHKNVPGKLRPATEADQEVARQWGRAYGEEKPAPVDVSEFMLRKLRRNELFFWDDEGPTTLITLSGFTDHGVRISSVYTPPEHRGKGYGSAAVGSMCNRLLDDGQEFVTLVVIDGDPAERIYQRLGFQKIGQRACYLLHPLLHELG